ncbi:nitrate- and nitrite sensing domain-containing protein, partial [Amycolatopsis sp. NPDC004378]
WPLAVKLAAVGLVPTLLAIALVTIRIADSRHELAALDRGSRLLELSTQVTGIADQLRQDRRSILVYVGGDSTADRATVAASGDRADTALANLLDRLRSSGDLDDTAKGSLAEVGTGATQLAEVHRAFGGSLIADPNLIGALYTPVIRALDVLARSLVRTGSTPDTAALADAAQAAADAREQLSLHATVIEGAITANRLSMRDAELARSFEAELGHESVRFQVSLTPEQRSATGPLLDDTAQRRRTELAEQVLAVANGQASTVTAQAWTKAYEAVDASARRSGEFAMRNIELRQNEARTTAYTKSSISTTLLIASLLAGGALAVFVARILLRSLRLLRDSALEIAHSRLPSAVRALKEGSGEAPDVLPVPLRNEDEIGQVARAFDKVHAEAVLLAAEQARTQTAVKAIFVNLSRRSQGLVERQLAVIDRLERDEEDPDRLAEFFALDHLATRMRRNSENLLVLAGAERTRRPAHRMSVDEVLRAALSEVEHYQRVSLQESPPLAVPGKLGIDLVHVVSELLDNATHFSPPTAPVTLRAGSAPDGSLVITVSDHGIGMSATALVEANQRMHADDRPNPSVAQRMGLFVVGRLSGRHGFEVNLTGSDEPGVSGITAKVVLPPLLLLNTKSPRSAETPNHGAQTGPPPAPPDHVARARRIRGTLTSLHHSEPDGSR